MVVYERPKYITAKMRDENNNFAFAATDLIVTSEHREEGSDCCTRCASTIAKNGFRCDMPPTERCNNCSDNNRVACTKVHVLFIGRLERLKRSRSRLEATILRLHTSGARRKAEYLADAEYVSRGVECARIQRAYTKEWTAYKLRAARLGELLKVPTQVPTSVEDFALLDLQEQRKMRRAGEDQLPISRRIATALERIATVLEDEYFPPESDGEDDDDDDDEDGGAAGGARGNRAAGGSSNNGSGAGPSGLSPSGGGGDGEDSEDGDGGSGASNGGGNDEETVVDPPDDESDMPDQL